jgi:alkaline phosphatase D
MRRASIRPGHAMSNSSSFKRRDFLRHVGAGALASSTMVRSLGAREREDEDQVDRVFRHGVASGDPLPDRVIIWTRVSPGRELTVEVRWEVALDERFDRIVRHGEAVAVAASDFTVKIDVTGLPVDTKLHYRFEARDERSPVGKSRTLPIANVASVKMAVFSCSNYPAGFFNVYNDAAKQTDIDVALHLGDYIYEYDANGYASQNAATLGRVSQPANELLKLADYRTRYAQYRGDADLQAAHAAFPWICIWDDHEFANDTWKDGAENHQANEGEFSDRRAAALQAYYEWMPIRAVEPKRPLRIFRSFKFGNLVDLHMLDTRVIGRDQQLSYAAFIKADGSVDGAAFTAAVADPARQLMGAEQTQWLATAMGSSNATWTVLGQQVLMGRMNVPAPLLQGLSVSQYAALVEKARVAYTTLTDAEKAILGQPSIPYNLDAWDGYAVARETVLGTARALNKNLVVLSGDTHNAWANDLADFEDHQVGVEFAGPGVTSPGFETIFPNEYPAVLAGSLEALIGPLVYAETAHRGYMIVTATPSECRCAWRFVSTVSSTTYSVSQDKELRTLPGPGNRTLVPV